ncbi:periodic tryptophan protein 2 [Fagus crenata]
MLISPVYKSQTTTLPIQSSSDICHLAAFLDGVFPIIIDNQHRCFFINLRLHVILHHLFFENTVNALTFSPNGSHLDVTTGKLVKLRWSLGFKKEFFLLQARQDLH